MSNFRSIQVGIELTVLAIDSTYDGITFSAYEYRHRSVYPYLEKLGFRVELYQGKLARRHFVAPIAREIHIVYITGLGHGCSNMFTGDRGMPIFKVGEYSPKESQNKIIHLLSCETAIELGIDMTSHGCQAFFGYDAPFIYVKDTSEVFWECDAEIDRAFVEGMNAGEVYNRVAEYYQRSIQKYKDEFINSLINGSNQEMVDTLRKVFSNLQHNANHLCSPSVSSRWGDVGAKL